MLRLILTCVQVFSAFVIVGLVLLQRGKGAEAGAGFGAGASGTVFGARGATTALSRATAIFAAIFMINSLALAYMGTRSSETPQNRLLEEAAAPKPKSLPGQGAPGTGAPGAGASSSGTPSPPAPGSPPAGSPAPLPAAPAK